ncbi:putative thiamin ABC transporterATP-binding protein [Actinobacillus pleuropneumoniae]|nr:putative thiamine ABC transporter ATP-binding protein [Actinobacillus pleuropneumoniae]KIE96719.1 putative thiamin ABC transporterATP-binding protein [Actinobacillus pleuropneumoniae]
MIRLNVRFDYEQIPMHFVLEVPKGQRVAIVGESGAGKSTLLNLIAGFEQPTSGQIWLNNFNHTATQVAERPVSMLFQDNNVFPHLTVEQNIGLALIPSLKLNSDQKAQVQQIAEQMGIADLLNRRADQLSGGQKQRVAWRELYYVNSRFYCSMSRFQHLILNVETNFKH